MAVTLDRSQLRHGRVRGRYFRENFAHAGIDLAQIVPELITNAEGAIVASGQPRGRIEPRFFVPEREFARRWRRELKAVGVRGGWARVSGHLRAHVSAQPGAR